MQREAMRARTTRFWNARLLTPFAVTAIVWVLTAVPVASSQFGPAAAGTAAADTGSDRRWFSTGGWGVACDTIITGMGAGGVCFAPGEVETDEWGQATITVLDDVTVLVNAWACADSNPHNQQCDGPISTVFCTQTTIGPRSGWDPSGGMIVGVDFVPFGLPVLGPCETNSLVPTTGIVKHWAGSV